MWAYLIKKSLNFSNIKRDSTSQINLTFLDQTDFTFQKSRHKQPQNQYMPFAKK